MKKVLSILLVAVSLCASACSNYPTAPISTSATTSTTAVGSKMEDPVWYPSSPLLTPFDFADVSALQQFVTDAGEYQKTVDVDSLNAHQVLAYDHMCATVRQRGILMPACYDQHISDVTLFPEAQYEDVGIKFTCTCNDEKIDYFIYYLKSGYENPFSMREYWDLRFGSQYHGDATELTIERNGKQITAHVYAHNSRKAISFAENGFEVKIIHEAAKDSKEIAEEFAYRHFLVG